VKTFGWKTKRKEMHGKDMIILDLIFKIQDVGIRLDLAESRYRPVLTVENIVIIVGSHKWQEFLE
jgi:hypothetical protein